jgi:hypothetical protein
MSDKKIKLSILCGILGCFCFGSGDWLMMYGDTTYYGSVYWLTTGVANIASWRNALAMFLAFPGIILYGIALFAIQQYIKEHKQRVIYHYLTAFGLTPWLCLHLFYIMILYLFAWMNGNGLEQAAISAAEALYGHLSWVVIVSEAMMLPPFIYWFILVVTGKCKMPKIMAATNPLIIYAVLYLVSLLLPDNAFRIGFTNGLMSESMIIWFLIFLICGNSDVKRG